MKLRIKTKGSSLRISDFMADSVVFALIFSLFVFYERGMVHNVIQLLFFVVMGFRFIQKNSYFTKHSLWLILFFFFSLLSSLTGISINTTFEVLPGLIQIILITVLLIPYLHSEEKIEFFIWCIAIASLALGIKLLIIVPKDIFGQVRIGMSVIGYNSNSLGMNMSFGGIASYFVYLKNNKKRYLLLIMLTILFTVFSGSRKALFALFFGLALLSYLKNGKISKKIFALTGIIIFAILGYKFLITNITAYNIIGVRIERLVNGILGDGIADASIDVRGLMTKRGLELFWQKPLIGYGLNTYKLVSGFSRYSHNNYIELMTGVGIVGTLVFYSMHIFLLCKMLLKRKRTLVMNMLLAILLILLILDVGVVSYYYENYHIFLMLAYSIVNINDRKNIQL